MALSQNVVINFLTKFDKKGLQRATKELKGFDKVIASSKFATNQTFHALPLHKSTYPGCTHNGCLR